MFSFCSKYSDIVLVWCSCVVNRVVIGFQIASKVPPAAFTMLWTKLSIVDTNISFLKILNLNKEVPEMFLEWHQSLQYKFEVLQCLSFKKKLPKFQIMIFLDSKNFNLVRLKTCSSGLFLIASTKRYYIMSKGQNPIYVISSEMDETNDHFLLYRNDIKSGFYLYLWFI